VTTEGAELAVDIPVSPQFALERIHERIRGCTACPLHRTRTQAVPGSGAANARVLAVGEAPGEREDRQGVPFVGAAGQVLTRLLTHAGIDRGDLYITNTVRCRPPGNRDPEPSEVGACAGFLDEQIALLRPDVILLLGRHALQRMLPGAPGISRCHGQRLREGDRVYVPLYHPAAALYNGSMMRTLEEDMLKVRTYLDQAADARRHAAAAAGTIPAVAAGVAADAQLTLF
jgi:DNA polymerase